MDFGSSHIYAGAPYYSDVPKEEEEKVTCQKDTIYEAVNEIYDEAGQQNQEHAYDPVAFDSPEIERRDYDLVPYEPNLDASHSETSTTSTSAKPANQKRSLSSSMFHKAKKVAGLKKKNKNLRSTVSVSEVEEQQPPPPPPPRSNIQNAPLPPVPSLVARANSHNKPLPPTPGKPPGDYDSIMAAPPIPPRPGSLKMNPAHQIMPVEELANIFSTTNISASEKSFLSEPLKPSVVTTNSVYPVLPNIYADVNKNYQKTELVASAPPLEDMVMNSSDSDLIIFTEPLVYNLPPVENKTTNQRSWTLAPQKLSTANAPTLSTSMVKRDTRSNSKNKPKNPYAAADTNVVSVQLGILEKAENSMIWAMPPSRCNKCHAVLLHHAIAQNQMSEQPSSSQALVDSSNSARPRNPCGVPKTGVCRFCGCTNPEVSDAVLPLVGNESDITYVLSQDAPLMSDDPIIVFCVDTSGSMCVTSEVNGGFMSRLQGVKDGIIMQLARLRQSRPRVRIAIVNFGNLVILLGDGSREQFMVLNDAQLYDTDYIKTAARNAVLPGCIGNTHSQLIQTINMLKEHGGTALGPALFLSVAIASRKYGSQVIVCTDGRANVGIGSLELESDYKMCHNFYKETCEFGIQTGTMVSILSIEGTDCRLVELGKVADKTAGKVKIGNIQTIADDFLDLTSGSLMATQVDVEIVTQKEIYFHETKSECKSLVSSFIGNATKDTEITFKYGIQESEQNSPPQNALFQLQVRYLLKSGCTCLRVITQSRPVTENRELAEHGLNPAVVGTYASQLASKLVLDGDLRDARLITDSHKKLISRALSIRSTYNDRELDDTDDRIYGSVCYHMDELSEDIQRVAESVRPCPSPTPSSEIPPPLPPRPSESPLNMSRSSSMSSLSLPEVPNTPLATREKLMEAVEHCPDEVARKLYKHRAACGSMFAA